MVLWQAVQVLPSRQRAVLVLRFHEDLAEAEVARLLGLPLGTVKSLAHRGLARLRDQLGSPDLDPALSPPRAAATAAPVTTAAPPRP
jgi:DNA-directed RNA polymerase specialized sigma24 family protein